MTLFTVIVSSAQASSDSLIDQHYPFDYVVQASNGGQVVPPGEPKVPGNLRKQPTVLALTA